MIYKNTNKPVIVSKTGRQYENTCIGCDQMKHDTDIIDRTEQHQCNKYPGMENFVRCMNFKKYITINTQTTLKTNSS